MKPLRRELADQAAHFGVGLVIVFVTLWISPPLNGLIGGLLVGAVREYTEGGDMLSDGSLRDMAGWALGGLLASVAVHEWL